MIQKCFSRFGTNTKAMLVLIAFFEENKLIFLQKSFICSIKEIKQMLSEHKQLYKVFGEIKQGVKGTRS